MHNPRPYPTTLRQDEVSDRTYQNASSDSGTSSVMSAQPGCASNDQQTGRAWLESALDQPHHNRLHLGTGLDHRNQRRNLNRPMTAPDRGLPVNEGRRSSIPGDRKRTRRCVFPSHPGLVSP
jgi:hypothetical protein